MEPSVRLINLLSALKFRGVRAHISKALLWLRYSQLRKPFSIQSHLTWKERETLYRLAKTAKRIAEIGSYIGASASCFGAATKGYGAKSIICIDTWNNDAMTEGNRDTWKEFRENTEDFSQFIIPVRGFSTLVLEQIRSIASELDLLFIDGDHSYEGVKADWEAYKALLREGSTVVFHDIGWAEGVKRVVQEDVEPLVRESGRLPNMWWGVLAQKP